MSRVMRFEYAQSQVLNLTTPGIQENLTLPNRISNGRRTRAPCRKASTSPAENMLFVKIQCNIRLSRVVCCVTHLVIGAVVLLRPGDPFGFRWILPQSQ